MDTYTINEVKCWLEGFIEGKKDDIVTVNHLNIILNMLNNIETEEEEKKNKDDVPSPNLPYIPLQYPYPCNPNIPYYDYYITTSDKTTHYTECKKN